jgi:hypothetical protein
MKFDKLNMTNCFWLYLLIILLGYFLFTGSSIVEGHSNKKSTQAIKDFQKDNMKTIKTKLSKYTSKDEVASGMDDLTKYFSYQNTSNLSLKALGGSGLTSMFSSSYSDSDNDSDNDTDNDSDNDSDSGSGSWL